MKIGLLISLTAAIAAALGVWMVMGGAEPLPARFSLDQCRHVALRHAQTGRPVKGAADMALLPDGQTLAVAAIDRGDTRRPYSGLFAVDLFDVAQGTDEVEVDELVPSYSLQGGVRPLGIALDATGERLAVLNKVGRDAEVVIDLLERRGGRYRRDQRYTHRALCRAHDLAFDPEGNLLITRDGADCGAGIVDYLGWSTSGLLLTLSPEGKLSAAELRYDHPSGVAIGPTGEPVVAEMRTGALSGAGLDAALPGAPDNLTADDEGALVAALHPSLWSLILYENGLGFSPPSRVVRIPPEGTGIELLYDDPEAKLMSAAGVALMHDGKLYIGSLYDAGIVVCEDG